MPEYNDRTQTFISKDDFFQMNRMDIIYTGYVEGLGYAFEEQIYIDESLYRQNGDNFFHSKSIQRAPYSLNSRADTYCPTSPCYHDDFPKQKSTGHLLSYKRLPACPDPSFPPSTRE